MFAAVDIRLALTQAPQGICCLHLLPHPRDSGLTDRANVPGLVGVLGMETQVSLALQTTNPFPQVTDTFSFNKQTMCLVQGSCAQHRELGGIMRTDRIPGHGAQ